jgi:hypothetical protein
MNVECNSTVMGIADGSDLLATTAIAIGCPQHWTLTRHEIPEVQISVVVIVVHCICRFIMHHAIWHEYAQEHGIGHCLPAEKLKHQLLPRLSDGHALRSSRIAGNTTHLRKLPQVRFRAARAYAAKDEPRWTRTDH